ncbi:MAG: hypothetical protein AABY18_04780 [Candidatus Thermoplasmatota archaeon]
MTASPTNRNPNPLPLERIERIQNDAKLLIAVATMELCHTDTVRRNDLLNRVGA